jgi:hypothetical protein
MNAQGKVLDALRKAPQGGHPAACRRPSRRSCRRSSEILRKLAGRLEIKNADERGR